MNWACSFNAKLYLKLSAGIRNAPACNCLVYAGESLTITSKTILLPLVIRPGMVSRRRYRAKERTAQFGNSSTCAWYVACMYMCAAHLPVRAQGRLLEVCCRGGWLEVDRAGNASRKSLNICNAYVNTLTHGTECVS